MNLALYLIPNVLEPMVEKLSVKLLLAALIAVMISIKAKIPSAIIITVIIVRNLLLLTFAQLNAIDSLTLDAIRRN